jgi:hypothetical protein
MLNLIIDKVTVSITFKSNPNQRNSRRQADGLPANSHLATYLSAKCPLAARLRVLGWWLRVRRARYLPLLH